MITISNLWPGRTTDHGGGYASGTSAGCLWCDFCCYTGNCDYLWLLLLPPFSRDWAWWLLPCKHQVLGSSWFRHFQLTGVCRPRPGCQIVMVPVQLAQMPQNMVFEVQLGLYYLLYTTVSFTEILIFTQSSMCWTFSFHLSQVASFMFIRCNMCVFV